jgi:hypothetical protein
MPKKTNIDAIEVGKWAILIGVVYAGYKILQKVGLINTEQETAEEETNAAVDRKQWAQPNFYLKNPPNNKVKVLKTTAGANGIALLIYEAYDVFDDDEEQMQGALKQLTYKEQYSQIAAAFYNKYTEDLTSFLKAHFNESELYPVWQHIENLPLYKNK